MTLFRRCTQAALASLALLAGHAAQAHGNDGAVTVRGPGGVTVTLPLPGLRLLVPPLPPVVVPQVVVPRVVVADERRWDRDGDGIPNRYDPVYNPRWDRNGDGVPDRYERHAGHRHGPGRDCDEPPYRHEGYREGYREGHHDNRGWRDERRDWREGRRW